MNTKKSFFWTRQMFGMQLFVVGGIPLGQLMKLEFKSWTISSVLAFSCETMGRIYDMCIIFNPLTHFFSHPIFL